MSIQETDVKQLLENLKALSNSVDGDAADFLDNKKPAAATRLRKILQAIKNEAQKARFAVSELSKVRHEEKKKAKEQPQQ